MKRFSTLIAILMLLLSLAVFASCNPEAPGSSSTDPDESTSSSSTQQEEESTTPPEQVPEDQLGFENTDNASQNTPGSWVGPK